MYSYSIYIGLNVVSINVHWDQSIYYMGHGPLGLPYILNLCGDPASESASRRVVTPRAPRESNTSPQSKYARLGCGGLGMKSVPKKSLSGLAWGVRGSDIWA